MRRRRDTSSFRHHRSGFTLVFFAMLLFGILGMAALVIDLGLGRITQRQLKQATDNAALEGLSRSDVDSAAPNVFVGRTASTETGRRQAAAATVINLFDDDFDPSADAVNFGAGPAINFSGGIPIGDGFVAAQTLTIPNPPVYKPQPELNPGNDPDGDIVTTATSLQVRLQRNGDGAVPNVISNGGPVPYLFGRGTLLAPQTRADGIELTVDSVAQMNPVVRVGAQQTVSGIEVAGAIAFGIRRTTWEALTPGSPVSVPLSVATAGNTNAVLTEIGQLAVLQPTPLVGDGYCAIVESVSGIDRVIGFGWAQLVVDAANPANMLITKRQDASAAQTVAAENATARLSEAWDSLSPLSEMDRAAVIGANRSFSDPLVSALLGG